MPLQIASKGSLGEKLADQPSPDCPERGAYHQFSCPRRGPYEHKGGDISACNKEDEADAS